MGFFARFVEWLSPTNERNFKLAAQVEDAATLLRKHATPQFASASMAAVASRALREIEQDARLIEKEPKLLAYYRKAYESAQTLAQAYADILAVEKAATDAIEQEEDAYQFSHIRRTEEKRE